MKVLVMGGTEFVSSSLAKYLISKGYVVDIFTRGIKPVKYDGFRKHLKGDRKSMVDLGKNISNESYDYVFDASAYTKDDVQKLTTILNKENLKRYVFCSSGATYIASDEIVTEEFPRGENENWGNYGLDKKNAEDYLLNLWEDERFPVTIFRPTYIYGEGNNLYREAYLFDRITNGLAVPIPFGKESTQFIYISDLVKVFESAIHIEQSAGQAYNVTHTEIVTWSQLVETAMKVANKKVSIKIVDNENINTRDFFPFRNVTYLLDTNKAKEHWLYMPKIDLTKGLELSYKWYCSAEPEITDARMSKIDLVLKNK